MIFVDTSAWAASVVAKDHDHSAAQKWLSGNRDSLLTTDYVIDETLTLLKARKRLQKALHLGNKFFHGGLTSIHFVEGADILAAWQAFQRYSDKEWSFTDCVSKVVMEKLGIKKTFSFDHH